MTRPVQLMLRVEGASGLSNTLNAAEIYTAVKKQTAGQSECTSTDAQQHTCMAAFRSPAHCFTGEKKRSNTGTVEAEWGLLMVESKSIDSRLPLHLLLPRPVVHHDVYL